ncbi:MAG: PAS domain-containing protein [Candidatus Omnitrophota bacterium]|jgi:PAS domain S-box-containing protein|nr:MAG: PAS domain-containing protein [Candidatus Omnitrophota bacterium]
MSIPESTIQSIHEAIVENSPTDQKALLELCTLYNENTNKLRKAFERLEKRFREIDPYNIYHSITDALITLDGEGNILTFNRAAERIFSVQERDIVGQSFQSVVLPCVSSFDDYVRNHSPDHRYDISFQRAGGEPVYLRGRFSPLRDRNGSEIGTTCLFADLSVERLLEEKARRSDRLTALGELAAGVAHEMRNPLTTIRGYLQILPDNKDDAEFIREFSDNLIREIDRLTRLTDDLLNMAKPISPELQLEQLSDIVSAIVLFLSDKFEDRGIRVEVGADPEGTPVLVDGDRMKQVFINLLVNAMEAVEEKGEIKIDFMRRLERFSEGEHPKNYAVAVVCDNGPGISAHVLDRLFDPFFTTKDSGTGLGLSLSHRIVEEHGGFLRVDSTPGEGTRFWVFIPLASEVESNQEVM